MDNLSTNSNNLGYFPKINDKYEVLCADEIVQYVVNFVQEVNSIVKLPSTVTRVLLSFCKWDKNLLLEKFYADPESLYKAAHVMNPLNVSIHETPKSDNDECKICCAELSSSLRVSNSCGHTFCKSCWSEYLKLKIMDEGVGDSVVCAETDCDVILDDKIVLELVDDIQAKSRYQLLITNAFVQQNVLLRWCPAPGCLYAIKLDFESYKQICCNCKCGHEFCFDCTQEWHGPVPCEVLKRFHEHVNEGFFVPQLKVPAENRFNTIKTCPNPNCAVFVQRISGCRAMVCKICSTRFCWICLSCFKNSEVQYMHSCRGEPSDDVPKSTETSEQNRSGYLELASTQDSAKVSNNPSNVLGSCTSNSLRQNSSITYDREPIRFFDGPLEDNQRLSNLRNLNIRDRQEKDIPETMKYFNKYNEEDKKLTEIKKRLKVKCEQYEAMLILLVKCRQTLKFSSLFAMYLKPVEESLLFKCHYQNLDEATDDLSSSIDRFHIILVSTAPDFSNNDLEHITIPEWLNAAHANCRMHRRTLLEYIDEGFDNELWLFEDQPKMDPINGF